MFDVSFILQELKAFVLTTGLSDNNIILHKDYRNESMQQAPSCNIYVDAGDVSISDSIGNLESRTAIKGLARRFKRTIYVNVEFKTKIDSLELTIHRFTSLLYRAIGYDTQFKAGTVLGLFDDRDRDVRITNISEVYPAILEISSDFILEIVRVRLTLEFYEYVKE